MKGKKKNNIKNKEKGDRIEGVWDIKQKGMMGMFNGIVKKHIRNGTEQAIKSIKEEAER